MSTNNKPLRAKFNDRDNPSFEFENQCVAYLRTCKNCGDRFDPTDTKCSNCGQERRRCLNRAMEGEEVCRVHATGRAYTLYNKLAATLSDSVLEEFIEMDDRDLAQEYALAKVALSGVLDEHELSSQELMKMVKEFFTIAEKKKNIEKGKVLNISWNDELANTLRLRVRKLIRVFSQIIDEHVEDDQTKTDMLKELKSRTKIIGNMISSPPKEDEYKN